MRVLVVADDFTGACDTGVQFARPGRPCTVVFRPPQETLSVAVVDSESRHLSPRDAAERVRSALRDVDAATIVLKKIDSTFRGNVGSEVTAALDACPGRIALVIPAFPAGMRTTVGGHCRVNGVPLDQTEFARDPLSPVQSSAVAQLLGGALRTRLASDPNALRRAVDEAAPGDVVIVDAQTQSDIDDSLAVVAHELSRFVLVGSAGLGAAVGATLLGRPQIATPADGGTPPVTGTRASGVLGVVGSLSERSRRQVELLVAAKAADAIVCDPGDPSRAIAAATEALRSARSVVLVSPVERAPVGAESIAKGLARAALSVILTTEIAGLVLTGGETALAVVRALGIDTVSVVRELAPGVPVLRLSGPSLDLPAVSKAGGFGEDDVLNRAFRCLGEGGCLQ